MLYDNSKNKNYSVIVSIPAIREELTIGKVISDIRSQLKNEALVVVCVRDEDDPTVHKAISSGADLVVAQPIRGYGLAHLAAMRYGIKRSPQASTIVMVDGDGTYDVSKLKEIVELSCKCNCLVIGNRLHKRPSKEAMSLVNYIG
ncbi:MAG: glycosyltransferase, partial [Sulfolobales archaeon]|nr:glycosyltransferase [Sulfolobales archaeon]MDW8011144.1 glycosyltransferase [Sulfolobales archaeon]